MLPLEQRSLNGVYHRTECVRKDASTSRGRFQQTRSPPHQLCPLASHFGCRPATVPVPASTNTKSSFPTYLSTLAAVATIKSSDLCMGNERDGFLRV